MVKVGDKVTFRPEGWSDTEGEKPRSAGKVLRGRVIYVHPKRRYYVAEGEVDGVKIREAFLILPG